MWRTVGSGWKRVVSQRAGVADCGEWVKRVVSQRAGVADCGEWVEKDR